MRTHTPNSIITPSSEAAMPTCQKLHHTSCPLFYLMKSLHIKNIDVLCQKLHHTSSPLFYLMKYLHIKNIDVLFLSPNSSTVFSLGEEQSVPSTFLVHDESFTKTRALGHPIGSEGWVFEFLAYRTPNSQITHHNHIWFMEI